MLLEPGLEHVADDAFDRGTDLGGDQLVFSLRGKFRIRDLDGEDCRQAFAAVVAGQRDFFLARDAAGFGIAGDLPGQRAAVARQMRAAVALRNVVGEAQHRLVIAVVPPHGAVDHDAFALGLDHDRLWNKRGLVAVEIFDEGLDAAFVAQLLALLDGMAHVGEHDGDAGIEESELAQPVLQRGEVELRHGEGLLRRQERHLGAALIAGGADDGQRRDRLAVGKFHEMFLAVAPDRQPEPARQRIDHRNADAMQSAGDLVGILVEFPAGMELRHDDFGGGNAFAFMDVGRNAAAVVAHGAGTVRIEPHEDLFGEAGERLVDGVVDDLIDHVVQAGTVVGIPDIHARPLAYGIEPLEHLDQFGVVIGGCRGGFTDGFGHTGSSRIGCKKMDCESAILVHEIAIACTAKAPQLRYCQIVVFQGFRGP